VYGILYDNEIADRTNVIIICGMSSAVSTSSNGTNKEGIKYVHHITAIIMFMYPNLANA